MKTAVDLKLWRIAYLAIGREVGACNVIVTLAELYGIEDWLANPDFSQVIIWCRDERMVTEFLLRYA